MYIYIFMFEEAEHFKLTEDAFGWDERLEHVRQLLESHAAAIARICHCPGNNKTH